MSSSTSSLSTRTTVPGIGDTSEPGTSSRSGSGKLGVSVTADSLARAMQAAGAENAAQLDVNATYPRFVFYKHPANELPKVESAIIPDVDFAKHEYVGEPEERDFFFLMKLPRIHAS